MDFLKDTTFDGAVFKSLQHPKVKIESKAFFEVDFVKCAFQEAAFINCRFVNCTFKKCALNMLNVMHSQFSNVVFEECQAVGIDWTKAKWDKGAYLRAIHFIDSTLNYSSLFGLKLHALKMIGCVAREVDFGGADLTEGVFTGTDFAGSIFTKTNLTEADFVGALSYNIPPARQHH